MTTPLSSDLPDLLDLPALIIDDGTETDVETVPSTPISTAPLPLLAGDRRLQNLASSKSPAQPSLRQSTRAPGGAPLPSIGTLTANKDKIDIAVTTAFRNAIMTHYQRVLEWEPSHGEPPLQALEGGVEGYRKDLKKEYENLIDGCKARWGQSKDKGARQIWAEAKAKKEELTALANIHLHHAKAEVALRQADAIYESVHPDPQNPSKVADGITSIELASRAEALEALFDTARHHADEALRLTDGLPKGPDKVLMYALAGISFDELKTKERSVYQIARTWGHQCMMWQSVGLTAKSEYASAQRAAVLSLTGGEGAADAERAVDDCIAAYDGFRQATGKWTATCDGAIRACRRTMRLDGISAERADQLKENVASHCASRVNAFTALMEEREWQLRSVQETYAEREGAFDQERAGIYRDIGSRIANLNSDLEKSYVNNYVMNADTFAGRAPAELQLYVLRLFTEVAASLEADLRHAIAGVADRGLRLATGGDERGVLESLLAGIGSLKGFLYGYIGSEFRRQRIENRRAAESTPAPSRSSRGRPARGPAPVRERTSKSLMAEARRYAEDNLLSFARPLPTADAEPPAETQKKTAGSVADAAARPSGSRANVQAAREKQGAKQLVAKLEKQAREEKEEAFEKLGQLLDADYPRKIAEDEGVASHYAELARQAMRSPGLNPSSGETVQGMMLKAAGRLTDAARVLQERLGVLEQQLLVVDRHETDARKLAQTTPQANELKKTLRQAVERFTAEAGRLTDEAARNCTQRNRLLFAQLPTLEGFMAQLDDREINGVVLPGERRQLPAVNAAGLPRWSDDYFEEYLVRLKTPQTIVTLTQNQDGELEEITQRVEYVAVHVHYDSPDPDAEPTACHFKNFTQKGWGDTDKIFVHRGHVDDTDATQYLVDEILRQLPVLPPPANAPRRRR